jgi:hypothetical protein
VSGPSRVDAVAADGTPVSVPKDKLPELLQQPGARPLSEAESQGVRRQIAEEIDRNEHPIRETGEAYLAGLHADVRGVAGSVGIPLDSAATGIAGLFGDEAKKSTREYLKGLDERHPLASGWMDLMGTARGAIGAAEVTGVSRLPMAGRIGMAGVENVVQSTAKDINEASLGDKDLNAQKLAAAAPGRFLMGVGFGAGGEALGAGLSKAYGAFAKRAVPGLEEQAMRSVGREVGVAGEEAGVAGRKITDLGGGIPGSRSALADTLAGAQAAERKGLASTLAEGHEADRALLDVKHALGREQAGAGLVARAEREATEGTLEAMAKGGAKVEAAELGGAAARRAAKTAEEEASGAFIRQAEKETAAEVSAHVAQHQATRAYREVVDHYDSLMGTLKNEHRLGLEQAEALGLEKMSAQMELAEVLREIAPPTPVRAVTKRDLLRLQELRRTGQEGSAEFQELSEIARKGAGGKQHYAQREMRPGEVDSYTGEILTKEKIAEYRAAEDGAAAVAGRTERIQTLRALIGDLDKAHAEALSHVKKVEGATRTTEMQAQRDIAEAGRKADQFVAQARAATPEFKKAEQAATKAAENLKKVEAETAKAIEAARSQGQAQAAAAEKAGAKRIEAAQFKAEEAKASFEKLATKEREKLARSQQKAVEGTKTAPTSVDPYIEGMRRVQNEPGSPLVSQNALITAGFAAAKAHPIGAAGTLLTSFVANRMRGANNLLAARTLRAISRQIASVDDAIRAGAAMVLGRAVGAAGADQASKEEKKLAPKPPPLPKFEDVRDELQAQAANPDLLVRKVDEALGPIAKQAPGLYAASLMNAQKTQAFLLGILPPPQRDPNSLTPHLIPGDVSDTQKYEFMRAYKSLTDPLSLFQDVKDGTVTATQVDAVKQVHDQLFAKMVGEVQRQTMSLTSPLAYEREVNVGTLFGKVTNQVMEPDFQKAMRASFDDKSAQAKPPGQGSKAGGKLDKNLLSTAQRVEAGE